MSTPTSSWRGAYIIKHRGNSIFACKGISQWLYSPLWTMAAFLSFLIYTQSIGRLRTPWADRRNA
jgi:hypothetical protein